MIVQNSKARGSVVILVLLVSIFLLLGTIGSARAQDQLLLEDFEGEQNLCVCGMDFYVGEMERVKAEITAAREADGDASPYYELIREWTTLRMEFNILTRWCQVILLELAPDSEPLTCPDELQE